MPDLAQAAKEYRLGMELYRKEQLADAINAFNRVSCADQSRH